MWSKVEYSGVTLLMFRGSSTHTIDSKGRIIVPSRFRDGVGSGDGGGVVITQMDGCLPVFPMEKWRGIEEKITSLAQTSHHMRRFRRIFIGSAQECVPDSQGRILIPPTLREYAGLVRDIVMVGVGSHFEIWSRMNWETENERLEKDLLEENARNEIAQLGI